MRKFKTTLLHLFKKKRGWPNGYKGQRGKDKASYKPKVLKRCFSPSNPNAIQAKSKASYSRPEILQGTVKRKVESKDPANMRLLSEDAVW